MVVSLVHCAAPSAGETSNRISGAGAPPAAAGTTAPTNSASSPSASDAGARLGNPRSTPGLIEAGAAIAEPDKCGEHHFDLERKPAEVLLVLDRSASMKDEPDGADASTTKWDLVVPAVNQVITDTNTSISWGMKMFPEGSGDECDATAVTEHVDVELAAMNASNVTNAITMTMPEGNGTPTSGAIDRALAYLHAHASKNPQYILLATDGEPSCPKPSDSARMLAVQSVGTAAAEGVHTFVVGVSTTKSSASGALSEMAIAGMEPRDEDPNPLASRYYLANSKDELVTALQQITGQISDCTFHWDQPPPVPDNIAVKVGGVKAPHDPKNGWEYLGSDHKGVQVHGSWCEQIKTTAANVVEIVFGCPDVEIL